MYRYLTPPILQLPTVYFLFPETSGLELEDVDHLFERGGFTGGVFETRGYSIRSGYHRTHPHIEGIEKSVEETAGD